MILDAFFAVAVPLTVGGVVLSKLLIARNKTKPFYPGKEGEAIRDRVNEQYRTTRGATIILILFVPLYGFLVYGLIEEWGMRFFTFVIAALMLLPMMALYGVVTAIYMFSVHGTAAIKRHRQ